MIRYIEVEENGKIMRLSENEIVGLTPIELDDSFNEMTIFDYKCVDGELIELTPEEKEEFYPTEVDEKKEQEATLQKMILASARINFLNQLPDEEAVNIPLCFDSWESDQIGFLYKEGMRREHKAGLWKCKKGHKKQESWYPGADPTLWEELDKEEHEGTLEDPIPVPESVNVSGFTYIVGKYYVENDVKYLCKRDGMEEGEETTLYYKPSELVDIYFVKV